MGKSFLVIAVFAMVLTGCFRTRSDIAKEQDEEQTFVQENVQITQRLDNVESQLGKLQGQIEEGQYQRKQDSKDLRAGMDKQEKQTSDLDQKLSELSSRMDLLFEEVKKMKEENASRASVKPEVRGKKKGTPAGNVGEGIKAFKKKDYDFAAEQFQGYLEKHPKGKRAFEASYYLGEVRYHQEDYGRAILAYSAVHEKAPKNDLWRKSTLRIAQSFTALGKKEESKSFAQILVQAAPRSSEAKAARKFLK